MIRHSRHPPRNSWFLLRRLHTCAGYLFLRRLPSGTVSAHRRSITQHALSSAFFAIVRPLPRHPRSSAKPAKNLDFDAASFSRSPLMILVSMGDESKPPSVGVISPHPNCHRRCFRSVDGPIECGKRRGHDKRVPPKAGGARLSCPFRRQEIYDLASCC